MRSTFKVLFYLKKEYIYNLINQKQNMDIVLIILGIICLITGIAGCFLPVLP